MVITNTRICLKETRIPSYLLVVTQTSTIAMAATSRTAYPTDQLGTSMITTTVGRYPMLSNKELNIIMMVIMITKRMELETSTVLLTTSSTLNSSTGCSTPNLSSTNARDSVLMTISTQETS